MTASTLLTIDQVSRQFSGTTTPAVAQVSLTLRQGDILGLLGPSGCGKTTLLRLIAGFERPQQGQIYLGDRPVAAEHRWVPPEQRDIGMVFQDYALFPHLTVAENIAFGLQHSKQRGARVKDELNHRIAEAIALVGLQGFDHRYPHELSGGQQQRVALARALAPRPALILLDEPLSNLDVQVRLYLRREVRDILKATGTSAVFVTHDQEEALAVSDQVAVMRQGQIEQLGSPEELYQEPASRFVAEFVTQANFIPAQPKQGHWVTEIGAFGIDPIHCTCKADWEICRTEAGLGDLMIRQEDISLHPDVNGLLVVRDRQFLGREYCYRLQTESGQSLQARIPRAVNVQVGDRVTASIPHEAIRFFPSLSQPISSPAIAR